ncbi:MAG: hypothetical protein IKB22_04780 [Lentisphaeria bacterium]|nr:hypothetical protein [Lentisphaeria bacterium]
MFRKLVLLGSILFCGVTLLGENTIGEGLGNTSPVWITGGKQSVKNEYVDWHYCADDGYKEKPCVTSGGGGAGKAVSWLKTTIMGPCTISFYCKVQTYGGLFTIKCDDRVIYKFSKKTGLDVPWEKLEFAIPAGKHTSKFTYAHPGAGYAYRLNGVQSKQKVTRSDVNDQIV